MRPCVILILVVLVISAPAFAQYSISGSLSGGQAGLYPKAAIAFPVQGGNYTYAVTFFASYTIGDLAAGGYIVAAFQDVNWNFFPDPGDPFGYYDGDQVTIVNLPPSQTGIDIHLNLQPDERFYGTIYYEGTLTGATILRAFDNPSFAGNPVKIDIVRDTTGAGTGPYEFRISPGTYFFQAHMDQNGDLEPNVGEPFGYYGEPADPAPVIVTATNWPTGIDVTMQEIPLLPVTDLTVTRDTTDIVLQWSPVPYVQIYNLYRSVAPNPSPGGIPHASVAGTTWTDPDAVNATARYFYVVTATDSAP